MMNRTVPVLLVVLMASLFGGCSTIINGTTQSVAISSEPAGARVDVDGNHLGVTPISVELKRKNNHLISVSMDGYQTEQIAVQKVLSGAVAGNIIAGGFIGWGVDAISGSQYKLKPDTIAVVLRPGVTDERSLVSSVDELDPAARLRQLESLRNDGLLSDEEYEATRLLLIEKLAPR